MVLKSCFKFVIINNKDFIEKGFRYRNSADFSSKLRYHLTGLVTKIYHFELSEPLKYIRKYDMLRSHRCRLLNDKYAVHTTCYLSL